MATERKKEFRTDAGIEIPLFLENGKGEEPGKFPYTRGVYRTMYRSRLWTMRQYAGFATAEETNKRYQYLLEQGTTGLSVAFDLPTQIGYDSNDPIAEGEVGKVGVAIDTLEDMELLFNGIPLPDISTSMTINATASVLLAMYVALAQKQGADLASLRGTIQNDILKEYIARGTYIFPPNPSMRLVTNIFEWCGKNLPLWNSISISGYHIREAGADAAQELAFTLSNGIAYVEAAMSAGLDVDDFAPRLSFFFNSHNNFFEEIAKFRAARKMWAKIIKERFGAKNPRSMMMRFHVQTAGSTLASRQIENNIVRVTLQALAAVLGGCQSLHTNSRDEALALPTEEAVRIALRTQQIIAYESGVTESVDPIGGSGLVEYLTDKLEEKALAYIGEIDAMGGAVKAIEQGYMQHHIAQSSYRYQQEIERNEKVVVGENMFVVDEESHQDVLRIDEEVQDKQVEKLQRIKKRRNSERVQDALDALREVAKGEENIFPFILEAVKAYATIGEITGVLRDVWGEHTE